MSVRDQISDRVPPAAGFAVAAVIPAGLLIWGALSGGWPLWLGFLWMALASPLADTVIARGFGDAPEGAEFPRADAVSLLLVAAHFALLLAALWGFSSATHPLPERVALFLGAGMFFGQVSNSNAHELIHRGSRLLFRLGAAVYVSLLFGHHVSAHRLVHHIHVATPKDPNSARLGEGFWHFFPRAWFGSFRAGLAAETRRQKPGRIHPYVIWVGGAGVCLTLVAALFGLRVMAEYLGLCLYAQMQLMLSDYVQHYGLRREIRNGRPEPVGPRHSWDAAHPLSSLAMVNAPRHSDHHAHPGREYPALRLAREEHPRPVLPWPLPVMGAIAMFPSLWRRVMDKRVARMRQSA